MKAKFIVLVPILGATVLAGERAQAACDARQEFCSYPTWAANAFSPQAQKPRFASGYPETYLAPNVTDYGYGPVFAYAPTHGPASGYGYGPTYLSAAAYTYDPAYGSVPTYRYVAADTYGPVPPYGYGPAHGYGPVYGYAPARRYAAAYVSGRAYGYAARKADARNHRRDWRWPSPGWPIHVKK